MRLLSEMRPEIGELEGIITVRTRGGEVHLRSPLLEGGPPKKGVNLMVVIRG